MLLPYVLLLSGLSITTAFPSMGSNNRPRQVPSTLPLSKYEYNSGPIPNLYFDAADQFVDVRPGTKHQFVAPKSSDKRGPCPGLNAAANHGFISHSGITTIAEAITGLFEAYAMGPDTATLLAILGVSLAGNLITETWSIGGSYQMDLLGGLLSGPGGLSNSHNRYESDASATRHDAYLNNGNGNALEMLRFDKLYNSAEEYTMDIIRDHQDWSHQHSIATNPYYFAAVFAGLVPAVAHNFIAVFMSNHSAERPQGYINREILKKFFSVSGPDNAHVWTYGHEQIPQNWYRRPSLNPYGLQALEADLVIHALKTPDVLNIGGNTGTVNTFTGVDLGDLTRGVYNAQTLLQGNNFACYLYQSTKIGMPTGLLSALALLNDFLAPILLNLGCPQVDFNTGMLGQFPGAGYEPPVQKKV